MATGGIIELKMKKQYLIGRALLFLGSVCLSVLELTRYNTYVADGMIAIQGKCAECQKRCSFIKWIGEVEHYVYYNEWYVIHIS